MLGLLNWLNETEIDVLIKNSIFLENIMKFIQEINIGKKENQELLVLLFIEYIFYLTDSLLKIDKNITLKIYKCLSEQNQKLFLEKINDKIVRYGNTYENFRKLLSILLNEF